MPTSPHWIAIASKPERKRRETIHAFQSRAETFLIGLREAINKDLEVYGSEFPEDKALCGIDTRAGTITVNNPQYGTEAVVAIDSEKQSLSCVYKTREGHNNWEDQLTMGGDQILWNGAGLKHSGADLSKKILIPVLFPAFPPGTSIELW